MKKKKLPIPAPVIEIGLVVLVALLIWIFVDASAKSYLDNKSGGCISVVFDKPFVKGADRIVIYENGQCIADISSKKTVRQIADLFTVANCTDLCDYKGGLKIEIYNGDRLVRLVEENCCGGLYLVYERDLLHWVLPSDSGAGQVELTQEENQRLLELISLWKYK